MRVGMLPESRMLFLPLRGHLSYISLSPSSYTFHFFLSVEQITCISLNIRKKMSITIGIPRLVYRKLTNWNLWIPFIYSLGER